LAALDLGPHFFDRLFRALLQSVAFLGLPVGRSAKAEGECQ
jgi:hypothetical protein